MKGYTDNKIKLCLLLFWIYFKSMLFAFTGGAVTLPLIQEALDEKYHIMSRDKVLEYFAIGQSIPGVISLNAGILVGMELAGVMGAFAIAMGVILPAFFGMLFIAVAYNFLTDVSLINGAIEGIRVASVAVIILNSVTIIKNSVKDFFGLILLLTAFLLTFLFNLDALFVILGCGIAGIIYFSKRRAS